MKQMSKGLFMFRNVRTIVRRLLSPYPNLFYPLFYLSSTKEQKKLAVCNETEIVIEGYPRSGNTFAVLSFDFAQKRRLSIAHHLHVGAQVLEGVRRSLPVMVLIRDPHDAIKSWAIRTQSLNIGWELDNYLCFYEIVSRISDKVLLVSFDDLTLDFGLVIDRLNLKFNTKYELFLHVQKNVDEIFSQIKHLNTTMFHGQETHIGLPSDLKKEISANLQMEFPPDKFQKAKKLYEKLCDLGSQQ